MSEQFQSNFRAVSEQSQSNFDAVSEQFQCSYKAMSEQFQCNFSAISEHFQFSFRANSEYLKSNFRAISVQLQSNVRAVWERFGSNFSWLAVQTTVADRWRHVFKPLLSRHQSSGGFFSLDDWLTDGIRIVRSGSTTSCLFYSLINSLIKRLPVDWIRFHWIELDDDDVIFA